MGERLQLDEMDPTQIITAAKAAIKNADYITAENAACMPFQQMMASHALKLELDDEWIIAARTIRTEISLSRHALVDFGEAA